MGIRDIHRTGMEKKHNKKLDKKLGGREISQPQPHRFPLGEAGMEKKHNKNWGTENIIPASATFI